MIATDQEVYFANHLLSWTHIGLNAMMAFSRLDPILPDWRGTTQGFHNRCPPTMKPLRLKSKSNGCLFRHVAMEQVFFNKRAKITSVTLVKSLRKCMWGPKRSMSGLLGCV